MKKAKWIAVGSVLYERVIEVSADWYEYKGRYARIRVWAKTQTGAKVRLGKYEAWLKNGIDPRDFRWKNPAIVSFFKNLEGSLLAFQLIRMENADDMLSEPYEMYTVRDLSLAYKLTPGDIANMPAELPRVASHCR